MKIKKLIKKKALPSFCTSNLDVLKIILHYSKKNNLPCLIECTSNQVNQFGGYTNKTPKQFSKEIIKIAKKIKVKKRNLLLGGDHLGPLPWVKKNHKTSLKNSINLINKFLESNYSKIHIDTSIKCLDDKTINHHKIFERTKHILQNTKIKRKINKIFLVIGSEVPLSGSNDRGSITITTISRIKKEVEKFKLLLSTLFKKKLIFGLVVEPGMRYLDYTISKPKLSNFSNKKNFSVKNNFVYEAHSTDYQSLKTLKNLTKNNFKFLKVGPELTYQYSRSLMYMRKIEKKFIKEKKSNFENQLLSVMLNNKKYWRDYYRAKNINSRKKLILNSKLDRMRYYFNDKKIARSIKLLKTNINKIETKNLSKIFISKKLKKKLNLYKNTNLPNFEIINLIFISDTLKKYYTACGFKLK